MATADQLKADADKFQLAGRGDKAIPRYQQACEMFIASDNADAATECLHLLGVAQIFSDDEQGGLSTLKKVLKVRQERHILLHIGRVQRDMGIAYMVYRHYYDAVEYLKAAKHTLANSDVLAEVGITEAKLGRLYALDGEYALVDECFDVAYQMINKESHDSYLLAAQIDNAFACLERGQIGHLENHLSTAWALLHSLGGVDLQRRRVGQILGLQIRLAINQKNWLEARRLYKGDFAEVLAEMSPACAATLRYELKTEEIAESLNF